MDEEPTFVSAPKKLAPVKYVSGIICPKCSKRIRNAKIVNKKITCECKQEIAV